MKLAIQYVMLWNCPAILHKAYRWISISMGNQCASIHCIIFVCLQIVNDAVSILDGISNWNRDVVQEESSGYLLILC